MKWCFLLFVSTLDAYARVAFCKQSGVTEILPQTLCPTWDQTLIFEDIEIFESVENVAKNPPSVVVELFDRDKVVNGHRNYVNMTGKKAPLNSFSEKKQ